MNNKYGLLLMDMQNDFVYNQDSPVYIPTAQKIISNIIHLIELSRNNNIEIIHIITEREPDISTWHKFDVDKNRNFCIKDTSGSDIIKDIKVLETDKLIVKSRYSAFYNTGLKEYLDKQNIRTLIYAGITTTTCISSSVRDAFNRDYENIIIDECTTASIPELDKAEKEIFKRSFGQVISLDSLPVLISQ